jgi:hypothetical protein
MKNKDFFIGTSAALQMGSLVDKVSLNNAFPRRVPDGTELELLPVEDDFDPDERARLLRAIDAGIDDVERGDHMDGFEFIARLRVRREATNR